MTINDVMKAIERRIGVLDAKAEATRSTTDRTVYVQSRLELRALAVEILAGRDGLTANDARQTDSYTQVDRA